MQNGWVTAIGFLEIIRSYTWTMAMILSTSGASVSKVRLLYMKWSLSMFPSKSFIPFSTPSCCSLMEAIRAVFRSASSPRSGSPAFLTATSANLAKNSWASVFLSFKSEIFWDKWSLLWRNSSRLFFLYVLTINTELMIVPIKLKKEIIKAPIATDLTPSVVPLDAS